MTVDARALLLDGLQIEPPCPASMIGSMAAIALPAPARGSPASSLGIDGLHDWFRERGVETWLYGHPRLLLRRLGAAL